MDLPFARAALVPSRRRRSWILLLAAVGFSGYGAYKVYHLPSVAEKRRRLANLLRALVSVAEAFSSSAETINLVSDDLNRFLRGDADEIPRSLRQISKIATSDEFAGSVSSLSEALAVGVLRGVAESEPGGAGAGAGSGFSDRVLDKVFSPAGSGFASVVVGSFARSLVTAFYSAQGSTAERDDRIGGGGDSPLESGWVHLICGEKYRQLIGDCIQRFVSTAVEVYLSKTMDINTYDEIFSGLTNPKHESKVKDVLVSVCNGAVETLLKTSHQVLTGSPSSSPSSDREEGTEPEEELPVKHIGRNSFDDGDIRGTSGWVVGKVSSTLAVPSNRRFVLDLTGRITFETVRSLLEFMMWKLSDAAKRCANFVRRDVIERGLEVVRYVTAKFMAIITVCLTLCLHTLLSSKMLVPA